MSANRKRTIDPWSDDDYALLEAHPDWPAARLAATLGRSVGAIYAKRFKVARGRQPFSDRYWLPEEDEVILSASLYATSSSLMDQLPGRSESAVNNRRTTLGVGNVNANEKSPYTIGARPLIAKTCTQCGRLLAAGWFPFLLPIRLWSPACKKCLAERQAVRREANPEGWKRWHDRDKSREAVKRSYARLQAITADRAENRGNPYTERDHETLSNPDLTILQKALRLKRTYNGVHSRLLKDGYRSHVGLGDPEHDLWIIDNPNAERIAS